LKKITYWKPGSNLRAWLFTIMHNVWINELRKQARFKTDQLDENHAGELADRRSPELNVSLMHDLEIGLSRLSPEHREALLLVSMQQFSYAEAARICGVNVGTLMSRVHRARKQLHETMYGGATHSLRRVK